MSSLRAYRTLRLEGRGHRGLEHDISDYQDQPTAAPDITRDIIMTMIASYRSDS